MLTDSASDRIDCCLFPREQMLQHDSHYLLPERHWVLGLLANYLVRLPPCNNPLKALGGFFETGGHWGSDWRRGGGSSFAVSTSSILRAPVAVVKVTRVRELGAKAVHSLGWGIRGGAGKVRRGWR